MEGRATAVVVIVLAGEEKSFRLTDGRVVVDCVVVVVGAVDRIEVDEIKAVVVLVVAAVFIVHDGMRLGAGMYPLFQADVLLEYV